MAGRSYDSITNELEEQDCTCGGEGIDKFYLLIVAECSSCSLLSSQSHSCSLLLLARLARR